MQYFLFLVQQSPDLVELLGHYFLVMDCLLLGLPKHSLVAFLGLERFSLSLQHHIMQGLIFLVNLRNGLLDLDNLMPKMSP